MRFYQHSPHEDSVGHTDTPTIVHCESVQTFV